MTWGKVCQQRPRNRRARQIPWMSRPQRRCALHIAYQTTMCARGLKCLRRIWMPRTTSITHLTTRALLVVRLSGRRRCGALCEQLEAVPVQPLFQPDDAAAAGRRVWGAGRASGKVSLSSTCRGQADEGPWRGQQQRTRGREDAHNHTGKRLCASAAGVASGAQAAWAAPLEHSGDVDDV